MCYRAIAQAISVLFVLIVVLNLLNLWGFNGTVAYAQSAAGPSLGGCPLFPSNNIWNTDISSLPVAANSGTIIASIGASGHLHPDFGSGTYNGEPIGIPYVVVPSSQAGVAVSFQYADESDPGPYPIPANAPIEGGTNSNGDRHVLVVQQGVCKLFETWSTYPKGGGWQAGSGAEWNLNSNTLRPSTWTSADAAGLPILPGLVRYDEVASGVIAHALRFTVQSTRNTFVWPARHEASSASSASLPPMGLRLRLKASVNLSGFSATNRVILTALKRYGMMVADNGSSWYISGSPDSRWNNSDLAKLANIPGSDFEVVDTSSLMVSANSGEAKQPADAAPTPTGQPSATSSPTTSPQATPNTPQNGDTNNSGSGNQSSTSGGNLRLMLILILGSVGVLLMIVLGIRRRLQEVRRLAAEAQQRDQPEPP